MSEANQGTLAGTDDLPPFEAPWQAQVMGLASHLMTRGVFSNSQWSESLGAGLAQAATTGAPDTADTYYGAALAALEALIDAHAGVPLAALDARTQAWRDAYLSTPHGQPVKLSGHQDC